MLGGCPLDKIEIKSNKKLSKTGKFRLFEEIIRLHLGF